MMSEYRIEKEGYAPVVCEEPKPCPFCGGTAKLVQLAHTMRWEKVGRRREQVRVQLLAASWPLVGDTFWFACSVCGATSGPHFDNAMDASRAWNRRAGVRPLEEEIQRERARLE